jgi:alpha-ketoglutarate-dependent taurine dioxygenase
VTGTIRGARRGVDLRAARHLRPGEPQPETGLAAVVHADGYGASLASRLTADDGAVAAALARHGAVLMRGFECATAADLSRLVTALGGTPAEYRYGSTPRRHLEAGVYTSTEYPADQPIPLHNEQSYARSWPHRLWFACAQPPVTGGATPLADSRRVRDRISRDTRRLFAGGVRYVRNFGEFDLSWPQAFGTDDPREVELFCRAAGIHCEWLGPDRLRTVQVLPAEVVHPFTGETVWFNQAHLFHVSALPPDVAAALLSGRTESDLPRQAFLGDGTAIPAEVLEEVRAAYAAECTRFAWERGDVLLVDNLLVAHSREPYSGPRRVLVAMTA